MGAKINYQYKLTSLPNSKFNQIHEQRLRCCKNRKLTKWNLLPSENCFAAHSFYTSLRHFPPFPVWIHALKVKLKTCNDPVLPYFPFFFIFFHFFPSPARPGVPCTYIHPHFTTRLRAYNYIAIFPSFNSFQLLFHFRFSHFSIRFPPLSFSIYTNTRIYCLFAFRSQTIFVLRQKWNKKNKTLETCASINRYQAVA